jgi:hypothetical protein
VRAVESYRNGVAGEQRVKSRLAARLATIASIFIAAGGLIVAALTFLGWRR